GQMNFVINNNFKLSAAINDKVYYSKGIYTDQFVTINHLESNEDLLIINSKEFISENSDKSTRITVHKIELIDNSN
ncbi:11988_t:CDS:1, partial [Gigaspora rosea]